MFKALSSLIIISILFGCGAAKNPSYISQDFEDVSSKHKKIAILPYEDYSIWLMRENGELDSWQEQTEVSGLYVQKAFFTAIAKRINKGKLDVGLHSFLKTNEILESNKITYPTLKISDKVNIGQLLGVNALILCEYFDSSDVTSARPGQRQVEDIGNNMLFTASLFDGKTGDLLWRKNLIMPIQTRADTKDLLAVKAVNSFAKIIPYNLPRDQAGLIEDELIEFQLP